MGNNYHKAARLFRYLSNCGVKKVVFSSTAAVYGTPQDDAPISETHPQNPINPMAKSKLAAETYLARAGNARRAFGRVALFQRLGRGALSAKKSARPIGPKAI